MKFPHGVILSFVSIFACSAYAQTTPASSSSLPTLTQIAFLSPETSPGLVSNDMQPTTPSPLATTPQSGAVSTRLPGRFGVDFHAGINGIGGDMAVAVASHINLRLGGQFFGYTDSFQEEGANVDATLRLGGGRASVDWFPFHNGFHVSPTLIFLNQTNVRATVIVPPGETISLDDGNYVSSQTDPLHGSASIGVWKTSPGLTIGYGNVVPRSGKHFSFPVELGFYYVGQPTLKVAFTGSACDPSQPEPLGCQPVQQDEDFQHDLAAFISRNNNNLKYASFLPVASFGVGYSF